MTEYSLANYRVSALRSGPSVVFTALVAVAFTIGPALADGGGAGLRIQSPAIIYSEDPEDESSEDYEPYESFYDRGTDLQFVPNIGASGRITLSAQINLRNLGDERTLVLINGKRRPAPAFDSAPTDSTPLHIEVVDVRRSGASALYGSDAVAGVINFITKDSYEGFEAEPRYTTALRFSETKMYLGYDVENKPSGIESFFGSGDSEPPLRYVSPTIAGFVLNADYVEEKNAAPSASDAPTITEDEPDFSLGIRYQFRDGTNSIRGNYGVSYLDYGDFNQDGSRAADQSAAQSVPPISEAVLDELLWTIPDHLLKSQYRIGDITGNPFLHDFSEGSGATPAPTPPQEASLNARTIRIGVRFRFE